MPGTAHINLRRSLPRPLLRQPSHFALCCIFWQQLTTERLCNKSINTRQTTSYLVCFLQKRCSSFSHAAAIREVTSKVKAFLLQKTKPPQKKKKNLSVSSFLPVDSPAVSWDCDVSVMYVRGFRRLRYHRAHLTEALHGVETCTGTAPSRFLPSLAHDLQDTSPPCFLLFPEMQ